MGLKRLPSTLKTVSTAVARTPPKVADSFYQSASWRALRAACLKRAGYRCELGLAGCTERAVIADHIVSRRMGGADVLSNLRAVCRQCDNRLKEDHTGERRGRVGS